MAKHIKITKVIAQLYEGYGPIKSWQDYNDLYCDYYDLIIKQGKLLLIADV